MIREAVVRDDQKYRYTLYREWAEGVDKEVFGVRVLNFVMLNPSKADGKIDDPTVRKCIGFAQRNGYNAIRIVNLFAFRATDPKELRKEYVNGGDVVGPSNDAYVRELPPDETVVVAWGATFQHEFFVKRRVRDTLALLNRKLYCLCKTKDGHPGHPVMLKYGPLVEF
jgi:hypothetical protein